MALLDITYKYLNFIRLSIDILIKSRYLNIINIIEYLMLEYANYLKINIYILC
jgi:hypothetical protein